MLKNNPYIEISKTKSHNEKFQKIIENAKYYNINILESEELLTRLMYRKLELKEDIFKHFDQCLQSEKKVQLSGS